MDSFERLINLDPCNLVFRCYPISCLREKRLKPKRTPRIRDSLCRYNNTRGLISSRMKLAFGTFLRSVSHGTINQVTPGMFSPQSEPLHRTSSLHHLNLSPLLFSHFASAILREIEMECCPLTFFRLIEGVARGNNVMIMLHSISRERNRFAWLHEKIIIPLNLLKNLKENKKIGTERRTPLTLAFRLPVDQT